jgi:hypothetical protein
MIVQAFTRCLMQLGGFADSFDPASPLASVPNDDTQDPHVNGEEEQPREKQTRDK